MRATLLLCTVGGATAMRSIIDPIMEYYDGSSRPGDSQPLGAPATHIGTDNSTHPGGLSLGGAASCSADANPPDKVFVELGLEGLVNVDQKQLRWQLDGYIRTMWRDPRLAFPPDSCRDEIVVPDVQLNALLKKSIWHPGYYIQNSASIKMGGADEGSALFLYRDGNVYWSRRLRVALSCKFNFGQLPYDVQYCPVIIGVYRYKASQVNLSWSATGIDIINDDSDRASTASTQTLMVGEWTAEVKELREVDKVYASGNYRYAVACFKISRSSINYDIRIVVGVLLVFATYSGLSAVVENTLHPLPDDTAPSASLDHLKAQAAPAHPGAQPEQLGSLRWPHSTSPPAAPKLSISHTFQPPGLFVSAAAAPGRIALAFLCFLMVLNNLNAVTSQMPDQAANSRIFLIDFLVITMIFNFVLLIEYAVVNWTIQNPFKQAEPPPAAPVAVTEAPDEGKTAELAGIDATVARRKSIVRKASTMAAPVRTHAKRRLSDTTCRMVFLPTYLLFLIVMFSCLSVYPHDDDCDFTAL